MPLAPRATKCSACTKKEEMVRFGMGNIMGIPWEYNGQPELFNFLCF